jgi:hypothetical protein
VKVEWGLMTEIDLITKRENEKKEEKGVEDEIDDGGFKMTTKKVIQSPE